jgi:hypothetical protein
MTHFPCLEKDCADSDQLSSQAAKLRGVLGSYCIQLLRSEFLVQDLDQSVMRFDHRPQRSAYRFRSG